MRLLFWNTQRLGKGSPELKYIYTEGVLAEGFSNLGVDIAVLCEVTSGLTIGPSALDKQVVVAKRTRKRTQAQLGYAGLASDLTQIQMTPAPIRNYSIATSTGWLLKGGTKFDNQSKRRVAYLGQDRGVGPHLFMYHANASGKAAALTSWVAKSCNEETAGRFLLVGDFNCSPIQLEATMRINNITGPGIFWDKNLKTHNAKHHDMVNVYDYAICSGFYCEVKAIDTRGFIPREVMSDHLPILVGIGETL
ncbi:hypothetical protein [Microbulbifer thermotolerans]|uniref:hypothetical protein n=1 Tax=Microbulbifer thermotolerans TaxID=252514 RepID=UPI00224B14EC|nr:hypothetical protein [Microbulbifer thermotolerans]MCX2836365.1 hypothetical protein [Microbulbifer thermotolerans]